MSINWKSILQSSIPLILGILIGAGFTKNKYVLGTIISYIVLMIGIRLLGNKIKNVKKATDKKLAVRNEAVKSWNDYVDQTEQGADVGKSLFDKYYPDYIFYVNSIVSITMIVLMFFKQWLFVMVCFFGIHVLVVLNQIYRNTKPKENAQMGVEIKDEI